MSDERDTLLGLIDDLYVAMLTTTDPDGKLTSRPMARQQVEPAAEMWFITTRDAAAVAHVSARPEVGVTFSSSDTWVALHGTASVVDDRRKLDELWDTFTEAWLPGGRDDPDVVLVRVDLEGGEYWDTPGSKVATLISLAKVKITGERYEGGDSARVDL